MSDPLADSHNPGGDTVSEFTTYEEYLDSQITPIDLYYLEVSEEINSQWILNPSNSSSVSST